MAQRFLLLFLAVALPGVTALAGEVRVRVLDEKGQGLPGATVVLVGTPNEAVSDASGHVKFDGVPDGEYDVSVRMAGFASRRREVTVEGSGSTEAEVALPTEIHFSESVTVGPSPRDTFEAYQPTTVLGGVSLLEKVRGNLGETLADEAGVNVRSFGPGPGRPVIRGLDNDRVLVVENGARTGDLSSQSGDHAVNLDPASAGRIEVVRGPATLLYGSNALGGVVNVVSDEIPEKALTGIHGDLTLQGGTGDRSGGAAGSVAGGNGRMSFHVDGSYFDSGDVRTPEEEVPNSQTNARSGGGGFSFAGPSGYLGAAYHFTAQDYGIPFVEEGQTRLNPRRHSVDVRGEKRGLSGIVSGIKGQLAYRHYRHDELEGTGEVATAFRNEYTEGQVLLNHAPTGRLKGTIGAWASRRDYASVGEEALAPATRQSSAAAYLYEEVTYRHLGLQFGLRYDHSGFDPEPGAPEEVDGFVRPAPVQDRSFDSLSASVGLLGYLSDDTTLALNLASAARNPSLEELYNLGPHTGNFAFEIGNPDLRTERGNGADLSLRVRKERLRGEAAVFYNRIDDFIFPSQTGETSDGLPVVALTQTDALLFGLEAHVDLGLTGWLWLELGADAVRGQQRQNDEPLPRIPPYRLWGGLRFEQGGWHAEATLKHAGAQERTYGAETPTEGYTVASAHASYSFAAARTTHTLTVRLDNASDETYRNHLSYVKDLAPEMGRSLRVLYGLRF